MLFAELFGDDVYLTTLQETLTEYRNMPHTPQGMVYVSEWGSLVAATARAFIAFKVTNRIFVMHYGIYYD